MIRAGAPVARASAGLVLAHGRGGSAADMLGLAEALGLPDLAVAAPEAPGRSWWPVSFLSPLAEIGAHVTAGVAAMEAAVAALHDDGLPRNRIWLAGFSQGACLALETFARRGEGLAGVFALAGGLVGSADTDLAADPALYGHRPKVFAYAGRRGGRVRISVHAQDPHIPLRRAEDSARTFRDLGSEVALEIHPGAGHAILPGDIAALRATLNR